jgi:hypothetical protein
VTHRWAWLVVAPIVLFLALAAFNIARHEGTAIGTPPDLSTPARKECPSGPPDGCRELVAGLLHVDLRAVPTIAATTEGLRFQRGYVVLPETASVPPFAIFEYASSSGPSALQALHLVMSPYVAPKVDKRPVGTTPGRRTFRIVRGTLGTFGLVFYDEHFVFAVERGLGGDLNRTPRDLALAEQLIDAVRLTTRQLDPQPHA